MRPARLIAASLVPGLLAGLAACAAPVAEEGAEAAAEPFAPVYLGIETRLLDSDLVSFRLAMQGARGREDLADYARCAAARYTLIRGYRYARHLRTNIEEEGGVWRADAVYTISPELPRGLQTIDAEKAVAGCAAEGIPTV